MLYIYTIYTVGYYSAIKNDMMKISGKKMELEKNIQNEVI